MKIGKSFNEKLSLSIYGPRLLFSDYDLERSFRLHARLTQPTKSFIFASINLGFGNKEILYPDSESKSYALKLITMTNHRVQCTRFERSPVYLYFITVVLCVLENESQDRSQNKWHPGAIVTRVTHRVPLSRTQIMYTYYVFCI